MAHTQGPLRERRRNQIGEEAVRFQPVQQLRMRAPVVAALPAELLALLPQRSADEDRARLVKQPVRLRPAKPIRPRRIEAIEHALAVEEAQPVLGSAFGAKKEQR
jgi:hypothetical protein